MSLKNPKPDNLKRTAKAGEVALITYATAINVHLGAAVGVATAYFGPAIERRFDRAKELLDYIKGSDMMFTPDKMADEQFQDGFVYLFEKYIRERNEDERVIMQKVLKGFVEAPSLTDYPLEEMADLVSRLRLADVDTFRLALSEAEAANESIYVTRAYNDERPFLLKIDPYSVSRLIYFGLLHEDRTRNGVRISESNEQYYLNVWISPTGIEFAKYIDP